MFVIYSDVKLVYSILLLLLKDSKCRDSLSDFLLSDEITFVISKEVEGLVLVIFIKKDGVKLLVIVSEYLCDFEDNSEVIVDSDCTDAAVGESVKVNEDITVWVDKLSGKFLDESVITVSVITLDGELNKELPSKVTSEEDIILWLLNSLAKLNFVISGDADFVICVVLILNCLLVLSDGMVFLTVDTLCDVCKDLCSISFEELI